jgi:flavin-dependent dehydrogenase
MSPETIQTDVLIVGKGVSGLLLHILLQRKEISSILLSKETGKINFPLAETIPPSTLELLEELNILSFFVNNATKTYGYQSKWNSNYISDESFFLNNKFGHGLKLNKRNVLKAMELEISNIIKANEISKIDFQENSNCIKIKDIYNQTKNINASLIVDATGRKRHLLKQANSKNIDYDETLAFLCYLPKTGPHLKYGFFTESISKNCWGTVSDLNETTRIVSLYASKKNKSYKSFKNFKEWNNILQNTEVLKYCLPNKGDFKVYGKQANSSISSKIFNQNILGVGDAAIAFDPISSHGISNAIYTVKEAAIAIEEYLNNNNNSLFEYEQKLYSIFNEYLRQKEKLYDMIK